MHSLFLAATLITAPADCTGLAIDRSRIDAVVRAAMAAQHIPGLALAVVCKGKVAFANGYGFSNLELETPVTPATVFKIGSVSKPFIATGIMLLVQDGRLNLDDLVSKHLPGTPAGWATVTLRHLLSHTSGIVREGPAFDPAKVQPDSIVVNSAYPSALLFPVGTNWSYCNTCYFALAEIIARTAGTPWPEFFAKRVFGPAGMRATRTTTTTALVPQRASGYVWRESGYVPAMEFTALRPSGAFLSTVLDLARWDSVLTAGSFLTESTQRTMATAVWQPSQSAAGDSTVRPGYGLGWFLDRHQGRERAQHGGALPGFRAQMSRYLADHLTIVVLTNADGARPDAIERSVATALLNP